MAELSIIDAYARKWWVLLIRGIIAILFGVAAFTLPGITLLSLVLLFGIYVILDGVTAIVFSANARSRWLILAGVLGIVAGILTLVYPNITLVVLYALVAAWAIVTGVFEIIAAVRFRKEISNEWLWVLAGAISILFGIVLVLNPATGLLALIWLIGAYALIFGITMILLAIRARHLPPRTTAPV